MMMKTILYPPLLLGLFLLASLGVQGCSKRVTQVDRFYGTSYYLAKESQLYNPNAGKSVTAIEGVSGTVGEKIVNRYEGSFDKAAPKTENYSISFGGIQKK